MAKTATVPEMLSDLFENHDWFDEEIAIGVGYYMPNHRVPSTQSVYRWRRGDAAPDFYAGAVEALYRAVKSETSDGKITITLPLRG
tara:strand:- start:908 stop:1165 length:258 start_codon:yes stop_codon:yes gene_type:complete